MSTAPFTLYTFAMSHYSEKIRWTLDHCGLPYREQVMAPVFHMAPALRMGRRGQTSLPVLQREHWALQDSARILTWLHEQQMAQDLLPAARYQEVRDVESRFNAIGKDVARLLYARSFGKADDHILRMWTEHASGLQSAIIKALYPVICWGFRRKLHINEASARRAEQRINDAVAWLEGRLADGRTYLVGDHLTAADITAASLLAPIACPAEHPIYGDARYVEGMRDATAAWAKSPAMHWVRAVYRHQRGKMQGGVNLAIRGA
jgi:glutathione S-transferase